MESKARILGHGAHPILIVFPLGLLATAFIFDLLYRFLGGEVYATVSYWMMLSGIVGGLVAAVPGWIDWFAIPSGTRAKRVGISHGLVNVAVLLLFAASWYFRMGDVARPPLVATILSTAGALLSVVGGWLGGELVERLGIAVHPGAHPDAPNSLTSSSAYGDSRPSDATSQARPYAAP